MLVPTVESFDEVYPEDALEHQTQRWNDLLKSFQEKYGRSADFIARSPGRVNIIGEHIDYSLYQCLPMAVTADVLVAVATNAENQVMIANVNPSKFPSREFDIPEGQLPIDAEQHDWSNYFKAGMRGASELLEQKKGLRRSCGMDVMIDGTVPAGGGLSSSAAFVCASALATMRVNGDTDVDKTELVEVAVVSERAVGVNSGGLDQAASVFALRGSALLVDFKPRLVANPVEFPSNGPELSFMIAQSFVTSNKRETAPIHYNLRVVECTLAALLLARIFRLQRPLPEDSGPLGISLRGFHDTFFEEKEGIQDNTRTSSSDYQAQLERLAKLVDDYLIQDEGYTREDVSFLLGISIEELNERYMTKVPVRAERFKLKQRALHVFDEALRVQQFIEILNSSSGNNTKELSSRLGQLLIETQTSCRDLYECSCEELDDLCQIALDAGAWGGRVTGAGWGGCSVHLVPKERIEKVKAAWMKKYYNKRFPDLSQEQLDEAIVVSKPGNGSLIYETQGKTSVQ